MPLDIDKTLIDCILTKQDVETAISAGLKIGDVKGEHAPVFSYIIKYWTDPKFKGTIPTPALVESKFPLYTFKKVKESMPAICEEIRQRTLYNTLRDSVASIGKAMKENQMEEVVRLLGTESQKAILASSRNLESVNLSQNTEYRKSRYEMRKKGIGVNGVPTGFDWLDKHTLGWHPSDLSLMIAKRGVGKSWFCLKVASAAQQSGKTPLLISPEMSVESTQNRYDALNAKIPYEAFQRGTLNSDQEKSYFQWLEKSKKLPPIHIPEFSFDKGITAASIHAKARSLGCDFIVFDGIYMMTDEQGSSRWEKHYNICIESKMMLRAEGWPMVITNQLNKDEDPQDATLDNSAFGDSYGMFCSVGMKMVQGSDERESGEMMMYLLKMREGRLPTRPHRMTWDLDNMHFEGGDADEGSAPLSMPDPSEMRFDTV